MDGRTTPFPLFAGSRLTSHPPERKMLLIDGGCACALPFLRHCAVNCRRCLYVATVSRQPQPRPRVFIYFMNALLGFYIKYIIINNIHSSALYKSSLFHISWYNIISTLNKLIAKKKKLFLNYNILKPLF